MEVFNEFEGTWDDSSFGATEEGKVLKSFQNVLLKAEPNAYRDQLHQLLQARAKDQHYGFYVDSKDIIADDPLLGHLLFRYPGIMIKHFSKALIDVQQRIIKLAPPSQSSSWAVKRNVHGRLGLVRFFILGDFYGEFVGL